MTNENDVRYYRYVDDNTRYYKIIDDVSFYRLDYKGEWLEDQYYGFEEYTRGYGKWTRISKEAMDEIVEERIKNNKFLTEEVN